MTSPVIGTPWKKLNAPVSEEAIEGVDKYWRAANYLSIGQIYLRSNPLMKEPFTREDVKHRLVGHWGTTPGLNFLIGHINRLIADHQQNTVIIMGPGHGGPAGTAQSYLDGTYTETFPKITKDEAGLQKFFRQFSYPGGIPSHYAPETPGSIHEGGELGYALSHAYGAVMNNPSLFVPAIVGDGEAETGPLATGWQSNKLVNPRTDGIVLPILHLNGYKIANPTILSRISDEELHEFFHGMGYEPYEFVAGFDNEDHLSIHRRFAELFETVFDEICDIKAAAQTDDMTRPFYPMIIFRTPKGWTCPKFIDGKKTEGSWRSHQVPLASARDTEAHFEVLKNWLESYKPEELFDENGAVKPEVTAFMPTGELRIGANPNANGGVIREELNLPASKTTRSRKSPSTATAGASSKPPVVWASTLATSSRTTRTPSASSDRTRPLPTVCRPLTTSPTSSGTPATCPPRLTSTWLSPARSLSSSPSTRWKASSRPTCSPAVTASGAPTSPSCT